MALGEVRLPALEQILDGRERRAEVGIPRDHVLDDGVLGERGLAPRGLRRDRVEALGLNGRSRRLPIVRRHQTGTVERPDARGRGRIVTPS